MKLKTSIKKENETQRVKNDDIMKWQQGTTGSKLERQQTKSASKKRKKKGIKTHTEYKKKIQQNESTIRWK